MSTPSPLKIQCNVVFSLFIRELKTRFGKYRLGYFWAIFDPISHVLIISFLYVKGFRASSIAGIPAPMLVLTGIVPFDLFRLITISSLKSYDANKGLFTYRRVKPSDDVIARILLEVLISISVFILLLVVFSYFGYFTDLHNLLGALSAFGLLVVFSAGLGFIASVIGPNYPELAKLVPLMVRPLYWISGIFYAADSIPESLRKYLLINPLLHVTDLIRANLFGSFTSTSASFTYLFFTAFLTFFFGLSYYRINRFDVITSKNR